MDNKLKLCLTSDLHGNLPDIPECDVFVIAGDICPKINHQVWFQESWLETNFKYWLREVPARCKVFICGNHDFIGQKRPEVMAKIFKEEKNTYWLNDSGCEFEGFKFFGQAWTPYFFDWAFNAYEPELEQKWAAIPQDTDIIVVHGPPQGYGDKARRVKEPGHEHTGSPSLLKRIEDIKPKLVVCGHIHPGYGIYQHGDTTIINASLVNEKYQPVNALVSWTL